MPVDRCIFCRIVAGAAEASIAYEDEVTLAFMDLLQFNPGHTLVVPKRHIVDIFALDDPIGAALMATIARVTRAVRAAFAPDGINVTASNGEGAGQEVFHLHFHVIPRRTGDGMFRMYPAGPHTPPRTELDRHAAAIRARLASLGSE